MGWLPGIKIERKTAGSELAVSRASNATQGYSGNSLGLTGATGGSDMDRAVRQAYQRCLWVFRCVDVIAQNQADLVMKTYDGDGEDANEVQDQQISYILNKNTNTYETAWQFRYRLSSQMLLSTKGAFIEKVLNKSGRVAQMHLLNPAQVIPQEDPLMFVSGYEVRQLNGRRSLLSPEQVIWIRPKPHPIDVYQAMTPLVAAGFSVDTDFLAHMFNRMFMSNQGRPDWLITVEGGLSPESAMEIRQRFERANGGVMVTEGTGLNAQNMSTSPSDAQWLSAIAGAKEEILLAFGVPESVMGNASGRTFDNADAERLNFYMDTVQPHCGVIGAAFSQLTVDPMRFRVDYDWSSVDVLQRSKDAKKSALKQDFLDGVISLDEYRDGVGLKPLNIPGSTSIWLAAGKIAINSDPDAQSEAAQLLPAGTPAMPADMPTQDDQEGWAKSGALAGWAQAQRTLANDNAARQIATTRKQLKNFVAQRRMLERKAIEPRATDIVQAKVLPIERYQTEAEMSGLLLAWSALQEAAVVESLGLRSTRKGTRHWTGDGAGTKALDPLAIVNPDRWSHDVRKTFESSVNRIAGQQSLKTIKRLERELPGYKFEEVSGTDDYKSNPYSNMAASKVLDIISASARHQSMRLADVVQKMDSEGASQAQIEDALRKAVGNRSKWRSDLATKTTTMLMESVPGLIIADMGDRIDKTWESHHDDRTRDTHIAADGQEVKADEGFLVGDSLMMYPGDPSAPPEETINCRCSLQWKVAE